MTDLITVTMPLSYAETLASSTSTSNNSSSSYSDAMVVSVTLAGLDSTSGLALNSSLSIELQVIVMPTSFLDLADTAESTGGSYYPTSRPTMSPVYSSLPTSSPTANVTLGVNECTPSPSPTYAANGTRSHITLPLAAITITMTPSYQGRSGVRESYERWARY